MLIMLFGAGIMWKLAVLLVFQRTDCLFHHTYCETLKSVNYCLLQDLENQRCIMLIHCQCRATCYSLHQGLETLVFKNRHLSPPLLFLRKLEVLLGLFAFSVVKYTDRKAICQFTYALNVARDHSLSVQYAEAGLLV